MYTVSPIHGCHPSIYTIHKKYVYLAHGLSASGEDAVLATVMMPTVSNSEAGPILTRGHSLRYGLVNLTS